MTEPRPSLDSLRRLTELLEAIVLDRSVLAGLTEDERIRLVAAAGRVARPDRHEATRLSKACRRRRHAEARELDRAARAKTGIRLAREAKVFVAPPRLEGPRADEGADLEDPKVCYVCKVEYRRQHFFYDSMCPACAELNYRKRFQTASLQGRQVVVTGARVKIGYQCALKCLRAGARVVATTRFPNDAAARYAREPDFEEWKDRLRIHGLDLRHSPSVEILARWLDRTLARLDILINNAAQTVRRPPGFYAHLVERERLSSSALPAPERAVLAGHAELVRALEGGGSKLLRTPSRDDAAFVKWSGGAPGVGIRSSSELSQLPSSEDPIAGLDALFPRGDLDQDLQQVDLRERNSWRLRLADVPTPEMLEVHLVNAVAPFILCSRLAPLLRRDRTDEKHIVNVSAMEGSFSRGTRTDRHPHTNMAKAALNMLTATSAPDLARDGIWLNAVDTGWVTDEDPAVHATRKREELDFQPPLDVVDGAARVCDPFFSGLLTGTHHTGRFWKDYRPTSW